MTTPEQNPANEQDVQELTDENLEEASGGAATVTAIRVTHAGNSVFPAFVGGGSPRDISLS
jgi:hypothetical protein